MEIAVLNDYAWQWLDVATGACTVFSTASEARGALYAVNIRPPRGLSDVEKQRFAQYVMYNAATIDYSQIAASGPEPTEPVQGVQVEVELQQPDTIVVEGHIPVPHPHHPHHLHRSSTIVPIVTTYSDQRVVTTVELQAV